MPVSFKKSCTPDNLVVSNTCLDAVAMYSVLPVLNNIDDKKLSGTLETLKTENRKMSKPSKLLKVARSDCERSLLKVITLLKSPRRTNRSSE